MDSIHILTDSRYSRVIDVESFRGFGCDTDYSLVVAEERLSVDAAAT
jgi:hypothetical protein